MKIDITPNLSIEQSDSEVIAIINKIESSHAQTLRRHIESEEADCFFVLMDITKKSEPVEATLYLIQHFSKTGDSGYVAYILKEVFKNRKELDIIIRYMNQLHVKSDFMQGCLDMLKAIRFGASLFELFKKGMLCTPLPHLN